MNDVLPKPFTKEGMLRSLEKHLPNFKKTASFPNSAQMPHPGGYVTPNPGQVTLGLNMSQLSAAQSLKDETSPGKSPATASSWQSPSQIPNQSPVGAPPGNYMPQPMQDNRQYNMTPTHPHPQSGYSAPQNPALGAPRGAPHRRVMSDMTGSGLDDHAEKRQRMY
jgi:osomolarity two-component system response regulator SKN7